MRAERIMIKQPRLLPKSSSEARRLEAGEAISGIRDVPGTAVKEEGSTLAIAHEAL